VKVVKTHLQKVSAKVDRTLAERTPEKKNCMSALTEVLDAGGKPA